MRSSTILIAVSAGLAAAQTTTTSAASSTYTSDVCAQDIVDACVKSIQAQVDACKDNDWVCLCENYQSLLTCYNNCPSSDDRSPVQNEVTQYCAAAAPILSASSASIASLVSAGKTTINTSPATTSASGTGTDAGTTGTGTHSSAQPLDTGAASSFAAPAGGALAVLLGVAGLL